MNKKKNRVFPVSIVVIVIVIIFYLIATAKQPYVECSKRTINNLGVSIREELQVTLDSNKISHMTLYKRIILPDKYLKSIESIKFALEKSYEYLDSDVVSITNGDDYILVKIDTKNKETIILNNITFYDDSGLQIKINPNTKSSEVVTLGISDKYTEGEFMTHMKNNGYICK